MDDLDQNYELHPPMASGVNDQNEKRSISPNAVSSTVQSAQKSGPLGTTASRDSAGPIPMSMPSILRNAGTSQTPNHLAYLLDRHASGSTSSSYPPAYRAARAKPSNKELGRRKQRRSENARLLANPHAVRPTLKDYRLHSNEIKSTFPTSSTAREHKAVSNLPVPTSSRVGYSQPVHDAQSANHGHFGKSLKDAQRMLKRLEIGNISDKMIAENRAGDLERFIWLVDREIRHWSRDEIHLMPSAESKEQNRKKGKVLLDDTFGIAIPVDTQRTTKEQTKDTIMVELDSIRPGREGGQIVEFQRTPNALVWLVHDPFLRLVVHCLARVYGCPSFSKDDVARPGLRFTWILNKNPLSRRGRRGRRASVSSSTMSVTAAESARNAEAAIPGRLRALAGALETPPTTDFDSQTESELESADADVNADADADADADDDIGTDEEEAEILRRVRRWAIDSHRQRTRDASESLGTTTSHSAQDVPPAAADPDKTLTDSVILEDDEEEQG
ncbi:hypothetical protein BCV70DRAFT_186580 [Testicularia cyperi]|uniref:R3H-associated N-terminal domain-containing protein n=1 Tax=Testicularia cyperi TaxID=1882483 RepID=A0A317XYJ4_9BASI|nr:hypothetical protein BCV70DRAFT_186580 [Testicularia cyperi]